MYDYPEVALREFIKSFAASTDPRLWMSLLKEELNELDEALADPSDVEHILKEFIDVIYVTAGFSLVASSELDYILPDDELTAVKALFDRMDTVPTDLFNDSIIRVAFHRVHQSNMSKLDDNGKPIRRADGKVLKGPNYKAPDLSDLV